MSASQRQSGEAGEIVLGRIRGLVAAPPPRPRADWPNKE
jgi:hypothetical protein